MKEVMRTAIRRHGHATAGAIRALCTLAAMVVLAVGCSGCSDAIAEADALIAEGRASEAEVVYREALASDSDNLEALNGLAVALSLQHKYDEALSVQERVIAVDPTDVQTRIELGFNYLNHQERSSDAVRVLGEAVAIDESARNLTYLAQAQMAAGEQEEAERSLERALGADPHYEYSYRVLAGLLMGQERTQEAEEVVRRAAAQGITIDSLQ